MKLGLMIGYSGAHLDLPVDLVQEAESLGYDSVWMAEAWGNDARTPSVPRGRDRTHPARHCDHAGPSKNVCQRGDDRDDAR